MPAFKLFRPAVTARARFRARPRLLVELLESRDLLSGMHPDYVILPHGGALPFASASPLGTTPGPIRHAYGIDQISFNGGTVPGDGSGTTIAIVDAYDDPNIANDLHQFDLQFGLPDPAFTKVNQTGGTIMPPTDSGWASEIALDVEWAHAIAPKAAILLVEANNNSNPNLYMATGFAAKQPGVVTVSMSWGSADRVGESGLDNIFFATPSGHAGVTFVAATGDNGAPTSYPAASPNVVAVGGTKLHLDSSGNITGESGWSGSGGGISGFEAEPSYQVGIVTQTATKRANPDVAYGADPANGFPVYDTVNNPVSAPWSEFGGTSDAAHQWAALIAIADQGRFLGGLGSLDGPTQTLPMLYTLPAADFHDITTGGSNGSQSYLCGPGYDLVTGLGTPVANMLVADLAGQSSSSPAFALTSPATATAGTAFSLTLKAVDSLGNTETNYTGTVHFTKTDTGSGSSVPGDYSYLPGDNGVHVFSSAITLVTAGNQSFTVADTVQVGMNATATTTVNAAATSRFAVAADPSSITAGANISITVTAQDAFGNFTGSGYNGTVHFTTTDAQATPPADTTLSGVVGIFTVTLKTAGLQTWTVADTANSTVSGTSNEVSVNAAAAARFAIVAGTSNITAGANTSITVTAQDAFGNFTGSGYAGTVHFTTTEAQSTPPADTTLSGGLGIFTVMLKTAGLQTWTATDTANSAASGTSNGVSVNAAAASRFAVTAGPSNITAGANTSIMVTAQDAFGNFTGSGYTGTVHFTTTDAQATPPADTAVSGGLGTFTGTLKTAGMQNWTATDTANSTVSGTSNEVSVNAAAAARFAIVAGPSNITAGANTSIMVTAQDAFGNFTGSGYTGTVHFTTTDAQSTPPADTTLSGGLGTFTVTLKTASLQTWTATDTANSTVSGTSNGIAVHAAPTAGFLVTAGPSSFTAGTSTIFTVTAQDAFGNPTGAGYAGTVHFSTTDTQSTPPADTTLSSGTGTFGLLFKSAGMQTLIASDSASSAIAGVSNGVSVNAAATSRFAVTAGPSSITAGNNTSFTVMAQDAFGNFTSSGYSGTVHFTSSDAQATLLPPTTLLGGTGTFTAALKTAGMQTWTVTDTANSTVSGTSNGIAVNAAAATQFGVTTNSTTMTAGSNVICTVTAQDKFGNRTGSGYAGTIHLTTTDRQAALPPNSTLTSGRGVFNITLKTAGPQTLTVTDTTSSAINGTSSSISVSPGPTAQFAVTVNSATVAAYRPVTFSVTAEDAFGNPTPGYKGTVHFETTDKQAKPPPNTTLTGGNGTFTIRLKTPDIQTITASDADSPSITGNASVSVNAPSDFVLANTWQQSVLNDVPTLDSPPAVMRVL